MCLIQIALILMKLQRRQVGHKFMIRTPTKKKSTILTDIITITINTTRTIHIVTMSMVIAAVTTMMTARRNTESAHLFIIAADRSIRTSCKALSIAGQKVRAKGVIWFDDKRDDMYIFEQAGIQIMATESGKWLTAFPKKQQEMYLEAYPDMAERWDEEYGDREIKLVFIGQHMDKHDIIDRLDDCLSY